MNAARGMRDVFAKQVLGAEDGEKAHADPGDPCGESCECAIAAACERAKTRRESLRWYLLLTVYNSRPEAVPEDIVQVTMRSIYPDVTSIEVRLELDYLAARALVRLHKSPSGRWWSDLTHHGIDIVEYTVDCAPGIARPIRYWNP
ncbi:hypothetical protein AAHK20_01105 [Trinickia sp. YCB016]